MKHISTILYLCSFFFFTGCIKEDVNTAAGVPNADASIFVVRNAFKGSSVNISKDLLSGASYTTGVVVSNHENKNLPAGTIAIQNTWRGQTRGILLHVPDNSKYQFGDSLRIEIENAQLINKEGTLMIDGLTSEKITKVASGIKKTYRPVSIGAILKNINAFEGQLVTITADVDPEPASGTTFTGEKYLADSEGNRIQLFTEADATFANQKIAPSATFQGIVLGSETGAELRLQKYADMTYPSGKLYAGWPESFEEPYQGKTSYNVTATNNLLQMSTGEWWLYQIIQGETAGRDRIVTGKHALRFQQNRSDNEYAQMNFDVPKGASKVTFWYGAYYTDRSSTFQLEYSVDQGATWVRTGEPISDVPTTTASPTPRQAIFLMDISQPVRFRINKLGLGTSNSTISNGRLGVDDFAIYMSY